MNTLRQHKFRYLIQADPNAFKDVNRNNNTQFLYYTIEQIESQNTIMGIHAVTILARDEFIGHQDKNEHEIYENDICLFDGVNRRVSWVGSGFWLVAPEVEDVELHHNNASQVEIIGTNYTHPHLLQIKSN